jgi:hypothetical protein
MAVQPTQLSMVFEDDKRADPIRRSVAWCADRYVKRTGIAVVAVCRNCRDKLCVREEDVPPTRIPFNRYVLREHFRHEPSGDVMCNPARAAFQAAWVRRHGEDAGDVR